jgi:hypothetical protein
LCCQLTQHQNLEPKKLAIALLFVFFEVTMSIPVSILTEIPEELHESLQNYLDSHPNWDQDRVFAAALSMFLLENEKKHAHLYSQNYFTCARVHLETLLQ